MKTLEKEIKFQLAKDDYNKIVEFFSKNYTKTSDIIQTNYYLDTKNFTLKNYNLSAKIREIDKNYKLIVKSKLKETINNEHIKLETVMELSDTIFNNIEKNPVPKIIENFIKSCSSLFSTTEKSYIYIIGNLCTQRITYILDNNMGELVIDKNLYLNIEDYEIEIESDDLKKSKDMILNIFNLLKIKFIDNMDSKTQRFKKRLINISKIN